MVPWPVCGLVARPQIVRGPLERHTTIATDGREGRLAGYGRALAHAAVKHAALDTTNQCPTHVYRRRHREWGVSLRRKKGV